MKVITDISQAVYAGTGVARFTAGLTEALLSADGLSASFFMSSLRQRLPPDLEKKIRLSGAGLTRIPIPPRILSVLWNSLHILPPELFVGKHDIFISSDWTLPPTSMRSVTVIHDLTYLRYPETVHPTIRQTHTERMKHVISECAHIITDSDSTKRDCIELLQLPPERISVLYPGVTVQYPTPQYCRQVLDTYKLTKPFLLTVGKREPRKNLDNLFAAFAQLNQPDMKLVVVGMEGWGNNSIPSAYKKNIILTGLVSEEQLHALYASCHLFVYPSLWEGFGYPIIEAALHRKPVACSRSSSLTELGSHFAQLFDPADPSDMAHVIGEYISSPQAMESGIQKGYDFASKLTWDAYATALVPILGRVVQS